MDNGQRKMKQPRSFSIFHFPFPILQVSIFIIVLKLLDIFLSFLHFAIIGFNLFGWIWPATRKAHLVTVAATAFSWFGLGIFYGWGYCPITQWEWQVKQKLGETNLPNSFIKYYADKISGTDVDPALVDHFTLGFFLVVIILSVYLNFFRRKSARVN